MQQHLVVLIQCRPYFILVHHGSSSSTFNPISSTFNCILWILRLSADLLIDVFSKGFNKLSYVAHNKRDAKVVLNLMWSTCLMSFMSPPIRVLLSTLPVCVLLSSAGLCLCLEESMRWDFVIFKTCIFLTFWLLVISFYFWWRQQKIIC